MPNANTTLKLQLPPMDVTTWAHYKATGDFAFYAPKDPLADAASGMVHVNMADWAVEQETLRDDSAASAEGRNRVVVDVVLRGKGVDDQGRRTG